MKLRANVPRVCVFFISILLTVTLYNVLVVEAGQTNLSDRGNLVWMGWDGNDYEIFLYSKGIITQITDNDYDDYLYD